MSNDKENHECVYCLKVNNVEQSEDKFNCSNCNRVNVMLTNKFSGGRYASAPYITFGCMPTSSDTEEVIVFRKK